MMSKKVYLWSVVIVSSLVLAGFFGLYFRSYFFGQDAKKIAETPLIVDRNTLKEISPKENIIEMEKINPPKENFLPPTENNPLNFLFFGDLMMDRNVKIAMGTSGPEALLSGLGEAGVFSGYDLISANLEGAVIENGEHWPPENKYDFSFTPEDVARVKNFGFNFFNLANNHLSDQEENGIMETEKNLADLGFAFSGCRDKMIGECTAKIMEIKGRQIALAGASMVYGRTDEEKLLAEVKKLASSTDLVIVQMHWGVEYEHEAAANQVALAHKLIDAGADIIIGHHPHVVQGAEIYNNKPIFYSLGNFIFDQYFSFDTQEELGVAIRIGGRFAAELLPIVSRQSRLRLMNEKERGIFLEKMAGWSAGGEEFKKKIRQGVMKTAEEK
jgi:hypothetical protein